ncbi:MAG: redoxin family protein [Thiovulaceae bacterium]|nr:redoxin family protein [Sulfurimonadaceae bacterium]MCW9027104.1 redoxin family protein [Sulfurimonadaceae bacterium]
MKNKIKKYIKEVMLFTVVMIIFANIISYYKSTDLNKNVLDINYPYDKSKPILIHIWASWCPTCKFEASNIQTISKDYQVLTFIVKSGTDAEVKDYMKKNSLDFNTVNDEDGFFARKFNVGAYPTTLIYNEKQKLIFSEVGYTSTLGLKLRMWYSSI